MEKIKCSCGYETDSPLHWEKVWRGFSFNLATEDWAEAEKGDSEDAYDNYWACPGCGEPYPTKTQERLDEITQ